MSQTNELHELASGFETLAASRGIRLPPIDPFPEQQAIYERFLQSMGLDPEDVDKIVDDQRLPEDNRLAVQVATVQGIISMDKMSDDDLRAFLTYLRFAIFKPRASALLRSISEPLLKIRSFDISSSGFKIAIGVMPMRWFNGQSSPFETNAVCLASTGSLDLMEIFGILFMVNQKDEQYAVQHMRQYLDYYVQTGSIKPPEYGLAQGLHDYSDYKGNNGLSASMTTAAEQFLIAHELAHAALGHLSHATLSAAPRLRVTNEKPAFFQRIFRAAAATSQTINVISPSHSDEYCADQWALKAMFDVIQLPEESERAPLYCAGAAIFLGIAMLVEAASQAAGQKISDSHPPAMKRLYLVQLATELHGFHEQAYIARRVCEFIAEIGSIYPHFEMPPILSRELNSEAMEIFTKMKYDLRDADYITRFR